MRILALLVLLLAVPAVAQVSEDLAEDYLETTHLAESVAMLGEQFASQIAMQAGQFPEPARAPFVEIYQDAFAADALAERLETFVREEGDADSLRAVLDWYEQPLAQQMQQLELESAEDDAGQVAVQMYALTGSLGTHDVTEEREAQMDRYLEVTGGAEAFVDLYLDIIVASAHSSRVISTEEPPPADSIRAAVRPQLEGQIGGAVRGGLLYAYRDVDDATFDAYIGLLGEPAARYTNRLGPEAMAAALVGAITDAGEAFAQTLRDLDDAGEIDLDAMRAEAEQQRAEAERRAAQQRQMQQPVEDEQPREESGVEEMDGSDG